MMNKISFVLNEEEVRQGLILSGALKPNGKKGIVQAIICGVLAVLNGVDIFMHPQNTMNYILLAVCLLLVPVVLILPKKTEQNIIKSHTDGTEVTVWDEEGKMVIEAKTGDIPPYQWSFDGQSVDRMLETEDIFLFILKDRRALIIPKRACDDNQKQQITSLAKEFLENLGE